MASSSDFVLRSSLDIQDRRHEQTSVHPERLEMPHSDVGELEPVLLEGYAAIDPGSTGTRAVIAVVEVNKTTGKRNLDRTLQLQDIRKDYNRDRRTTRGEWPSKCCPFGGPPYHVGYDADSQVKQRTISIKAIPYFRTQDDDGDPSTKALYDHYRSLPSEIERQDFNDALDDILLNFFNQVVQRIFSHCQEARIKLCSVALCIPQTWSRRERPIQEYLSPIFDQTVATPSVETTFALEAQCQAQYLISKYPWKLRDFDQLIVLDFGGHAMGGSYSELQWGSAGGKPKFYALPGSEFGIRGGYELWKIGISNCIDEVMSRNPKAWPQNRRHMIISKFLEGFFNSKAEITFDHPHRLHVDLVDYYNDPKALYAIHISAEQLKQQWESAFRQPINLATRNIKSRVRTGSRLKVLVTGGSANSQDLRNEIHGVCNELSEQGFNVTCTVVEEELDVVTAPKWSIAIGAARCDALTMDTEEFFDLGAAFGLQTLVSVENEEISASESGELLYYKQNGVDRCRKIPIEIDGAKRKFRVIANPFQVDPRARETSNFVRLQDSYDIWDIVLEYCSSPGGDPMPIPNGKYVLEVAEIVCNGRDAILVLRMRPKLRPSGTRRSKRIQEKLAQDCFGDRSLLFDVPLVSCGHNNLVELDIDVIRGRFWRLEGDADDSSLEEQSEGGVKLETMSSPPPAKRRRIDDLFSIG